MAHLTHFGGGSRKKRISNCGERACIHTRSRLGGLDCLVKKKVELKNVETRAFLTVCEVLQLLTNVSW